MESITKREEKKRIEADKRMQAIREKYKDDIESEETLPHVGYTRKETLNILQSGLNEAD